MSILITGGYGLLGSWLAHDLAKAGKKVIQFGPNIRQFDYLEGLEDHLIQIRGNVLEKEEMDRVLKESGEEIEGVIHTPSILPGQNHENIVEMNVTGSVNVMDLAKRWGVDKFVYISSGAVYGETDEIPSEDQEVKPSDLYGATKAAVEVIGKNYDLDFRSVRAYFFFGPGKLPSQSVPIFKTAFGAMEGIPELKLEAGSDQRLSFTYVKDASQGTLKVYDAEEVGEGMFNIATDEVMGLVELAAMAKRYHPSSQIEIGPGKLLRRGETLDTTLARTKLGFRPEYSIESGVEEYHEWIQRKIN